MFLLAAATIAIQTVRGDEGIEYTDRWDLRVTQPIIHFVSPGVIQVSYLPRYNLSLDLGDELDIVSTISITTGGQTTTVWMDEDVVMPSGGSFNTCKTVNCAIGLCGYSWCGYKINGVQYYEYCQEQMGPCQCRADVPPELCQSSFGGWCSCPVSVPRAFSPNINIPGASTLTIRIEPISGDAAPGDNIWQVQIQ
jgi:hypothetical protein